MVTAPENSHKPVIYPDAQIDNIFATEVVQCIEDTDFFNVMVRPKNSAAKCIRWDVAKNFWHEIQSKNLRLSIPAEKLILLEG